MNHYPSTKSNVGSTCGNGNPTAKEVVPYLDENNCHHATIHPSLKMALCPSPWLKDTALSDNTKLTLSTNGNLKPDHLKRINYDIDHHRWHPTSRATPLTSMKLNPRRQSEENQGPQDNSSKKGTMLKRHRYAVGQTRPRFSPGAKVEGNKPKMTPLGKK